MKSKYLILTDGHMQINNELIAYEKELMNYVGTDQHLKALNLHHGKIEQDRCTKAIAQQDRRIMMARAKKTGMRIRNFILLIIILLLVIHICG